jgi:hypothetical protein
VSRENRKIPVWSVLHDPGLMLKRPWCLDEVEMGLGPDNDIYHTPWIRGSLKGIKTLNGDDGDDVRFVRGLLPVSFTEDFGKNHMALTVWMHLVTKYNFRIRRDYLAVKIGVSKQTVTKAFREMMALGYMVKIRVSRGRGCPEWRLKVFAHPSLAAMFVSLLNIGDHPHYELQEGR